MTPSVNNTCNSTSNMKNFETLVRNLKLAIIVTVLKLLSCYFLRGLKLDESTTFGLTFSFPLHLQIF